MKITLKLFASFRDLTDMAAQGTCEISLPANTAVDDVLKQLRIPDDMPKIILVNGIHKTASSILQEGDTLSIFPPIAGG